MPSRNNSYNAGVLDVQRIYESQEGKRQSNTYRILVDRLWPRGISKDKAGIDLWLRDIAPSDQLRKWFSHDPKKWNEFRKRYFKELDSKEDLVEQILHKLHSGDPICLLYGAKDKKFNNAVALREYLSEKLVKEKTK